MFPGVSPDMLRGTVEWLLSGLTLLSAFWSFLLLPRS